MFAIAALGFVGLVVGCSPTYYRQQADRQTYPIIGERVVSPLYQIGRMDIAPAPQSRLADPHDPDSVPKPPDDLAAAGFMARPGGIRGSVRWGRFGYSDTIEPLGWESSLGLEPDGTLKLNQQKAVEVALDNSRELQTALENVFLQALQLTLNRFEFQLQWFGRTGPTFVRTGSGPTQSNLLTLDSDVGFTQNLAAGGQLLVNFANSFVWEFTGRTHTVGTNFGFQLVQPLLRGFGRDIRLESLTQAERDTLYAVRDYARFRKQFWASTAVLNGGYLDLLLQVQTVRNAKLNLRSQEQNYNLNRELFLGNKKTVVEVDQAFQNVLSGRQQLLDAEIGLQNALDGYKLRLGLPPRMPVELDDSLLQPFVLVDSDIEALRDKLEEFTKTRNAEVQLKELPSAVVIQGKFDELAGLVEPVRKAVAAAEKDLAEWKKVMDRPAKAVDDKEGRERAADTFAALKGSPAADREALKVLSELIARHKTEVTDAKRKDGLETLIADLKKLTSVLDEAITMQSLARIYRIELPAVEWTEGDALTFAKENRLDLQNRQALVTDSWRKVIVAANALKGDLNVTVGGTAVTAADAKQPFDFSDQASRFTVGVQLDGPLNRLAERNVYRASQVTYQRTRRAFQALSDSIEQDIRGDLRSLRQSRVSFEIQRQSLIAAARQVENERVQQGAPGPQPAGRDVALQTLRALDNLNSARNAFVFNYIRYEQLRVQLLLDLEALQLDDRGFPTNADPTSAAGRIDRPVPDGRKPVGDGRPVPVGLDAGRPDFPATLPAVRVPALPARAPDGGQGPGAPTAVGTGPVPPARLP